MNNKNLTMLAGIAAIISIAMPAGADEASPVQPAPEFSRCEASGSSIEYRTYLPDRQRYVFVLVKALAGLHPSVFLFVDKNFESKGVNLSNRSDPLVSWWLDRSRPMTFKSDKVKVSWKQGGVWHSITSLVVSSDAPEVVQPIRGLEPRDGHFEGNGSPDTNSFAFQSRVELPDFQGDELLVQVPAISFDGVTVAPPAILFTNTEQTPGAKC